MFHYKPGNVRKLPSKTQEYGFIAQDVQEIFPEAVTQDADGYLSFNIHPISVAMVNAVQELKQENDKLKQQNDQLISYLCAKDPAAPFCQ
jgi:hypothetical protein